MNIFLLSWCINECVIWHFDRHVVKMILEYAQLLSTTHWVLDDNNQIEKWKENGLIYKSTHVNHPCAIWARENINNYRFLVKLAKALCEEYYFRYGKEKNKRHKTEKIIDHLLKNEPKGFEKTNKPLISEHNVTEPAQAMPGKYKDKNVIEAYRNYYLGEEKSHLTFWKNRKEPEWFDICTVSDSDSDS